MPSTTNNLIANPSDPSSPSFYPASQTLLLILDYHSFFVQQIGEPWGPLAAKQAIRLRSWAKSQNVAVAHAMVDPDASPPVTCKGQERLVSVCELLKSDSEKCDEPEGIRAVEGDDEAMLLRAPGYVSALKSEGCEEFLERKGYKSLVLCGLSTSGCVMRTAFAASDAGYVVTVVEDACADRGDKLHGLLVEKVLPARAHVCALDVLVEKWKGNAV